MTTIDGYANTTIRETVQFRLAQMLISSARRSNRVRSATDTRALFFTIVRHVLHLAGFASLTIAAFSASMIAGFVVMGISLFVYSALITPGSTDDQRN